jgi:hypothetical protein
MNHLAEHHGGTPLMFWAGYKTFLLGGTAQERFIEKFDEKLAL